MGSVGLLFWPEDSRGFVVELDGSFQRRQLTGGLSLISDAGVMITDPLTTLAISEQLVKEVELRTLGEAVTLVGTVQDALNEADRWTSVSLADGRFLAAEDGSSGAVEDVMHKMEVSCKVIGVEDGRFRIGGVGCGGFSEVVEEGLK